MTAPGALTADRLRRDLPECLAVPRWVDDVANGAPYASLDQLLEAASRAATLSPDEIEQALAHHPRIGDRPTGEGRSQAFSRAEQASADADDVALAAALAEGNRSYEERFDRVFLIRAAGRSRAEMLAELRRRLGNDDATELAEVGEQLRQITLLRVEKLYGTEEASA